MPGNVNILVLRSLHTLAWLQHVTGKTPQRSVVIYLSCPSLDGYNEEFVSQQQMWSLLKLLSMHLGVKRAHKVEISMFATADVRCMRSATCFQHE